MKPRFVVPVAAAALTMLVTPLAVAQPDVPTTEPSYLQQRVPVRSQVFELTIGSGYAEGFGTLEPGVAMPRVANAGIGFEAAFGYRIDPHYSFSLGGEYQELGAERGEAVRGFLLDLALRYHIAPTRRVDPWLEVASGYRMLRLVPGGAASSVFVHGPELVRLRAGVDLRLSRGVAISPVIGADATMFVFHEAETFEVISNPKLSTFVFAGLEGRFDLGGPHPVSASATAP